MASTNWGPSNNNLRRAPDVKSDQRSKLAVEHEVTAMRLARVRFTIRSLMGVVGLTALLIGGAILLLRDTAATRSPLPDRSTGGVIMRGRNVEPIKPEFKPVRPKGVIMEGVDINWRPRGERQVLPREFLPAELDGGRRF
jgi:hypothetical protein